MLTDFIFLFFCKIYCFYRVGVKQSFRIIVGSLTFVLFFYRYLSSFLPRVEKVVMHLHVSEQIPSGVSPKPCCLLTPTGNIRLGRHFES